MKLLNLVGKSMDIRRVIGNPKSRLNSTIKEKQHTVFSLETKNKL